MAKRITPQQIAFFHHELGQNNAKRTKVALQDLCALCRKGVLIPPNVARTFEREINGLILQDEQDPKVVRWCLNALAQFGNYRESHNYVEIALTRYAGDPEIEAAGVAALCHMHRGSVDDIAVLSAIDPVVWKLAALQNTSPKKIDLSGMKIDIDKAEASVLRLALITVGLNRDIENLFHPKHSNNDFVRSLGQHPDDVVQQYSVWSVIENRRLVFEDLGVSLDDIEGLQPNVQSKAYQLVAERDPDDHRRLELTLSGSYSRHDEAREGLSKGVKSHYYDGLADITIEWFGRENVGAARGNLAEHFARFAGECPPYEALVLKINEQDQSLRERLLLGAEGKRLYSQLKATETPNLFSGHQGFHDLGQTIRARDRRGRRILLMSASPVDKGRVRSEVELRDIKAKIRELDGATSTFEFVTKPAARPEDVLTAVLTPDIEIFHFSGHGAADGLLLEGEAAKARHVSGSAIAGHLKRAGTSLKCVVFNACYSQALAIEVAPHIDVMICCDGKVADAEAIAFSAAFYAALATGRPYEAAFELAKNDVALRHSPEAAERYRIHLRR